MVHILLVYFYLWQLVDAVPFAKEIVSFPVPSQNDLKFPKPDSKEVQQRKVFEFVPEHLPYMHPELNGKIMFWICNQYSIVRLHFVYLYM